MSILDLPQQDHMQPSGCYYSVFTSATRTNTSRSNSVQYFCISDWPVIVYLPYNTSITFAKGQWFTIDLKFVSLFCPVVNSN